MNSGLAHVAMHGHAWRLPVWVGIGEAGTAWSDEGSNGMRVLDPCIVLEVRRAMALRRASAHVAAEALHAARAIQVHASMAQPGWPTARAWRRYWRAHGVMLSNIMHSTGSHELMKMRHAMQTHAADYRMRAKKWRMRARAAQRVEPGRHDLDYAASRTPPLKHTYW